MQPSGEWAREMDVAAAAARAGGAAAMKFYGAVEAELKVGGSPVTEADRAANAVILDLLRGAFPDDAVLSEESKDSLDRLSHRRVWIVDPLDGTKEFLSMNGEFSVMVGLAVDGVATVGAVYAPATGRLYRAARDAGSWREERGAVSPSRCTDATSRGVRAAVSRSHRDPVLQAVLDAVGPEATVISGSVGLKCALIIDGAADLYVHPSPFLREWDTCAPEVIAREAGCAVTDCAARSLRYNKRDPAQGAGIFVHSPACPQGAVETALAVCREARLDPA